MTKDDFTGKFHLHEISLAQHGVPQIVEEIVGVVKRVLQERKQQRTVERVVDVPVRQIMEEIIKLVRQSGTDCRRARCGVTPGDIGAAVALHQPKTRTRRTRRRSMQRNHVETYGVIAGSTIREEMLKFKFEAGDKMKTVQDAWNGLDKNM